IKAIGFETPGDVSVLKNVQIHDPSPESQDVKIRVMAVSVNPVDTKLRQGAFGPPQNPPMVLGYDASGVVEAVGNKVQRFKVGDQVMMSGSHVRQGTNAEFVIVDERLVGRKPETMSHRETAALPLVGLTAWEALVEKMGIPESKTPVDKTLLIINGAGGVGSFASQLARHVLGFKTVISTASRPETIEWCKTQGATHTINHRKPLKEQIDALGATVDYALICYDTNKYLGELCEIVQPLGQITSIVEVDSNMPLQGGMLKAISFHWEFMFSKPMHNVDLLSQGLALDKIAQFVDSGKLKRLDTKVYDNLTLENLKAAHEALESGKAIGKIVLEVGKGSWN
ncbi:hypothetical protein INT43_002038, partial [Umbelopsis isabellina]